MLEAGPGRDMSSSTPSSLCGENAWPPTAAPTSMRGSAAAVAAIRESRTILRMMSLAAEAEGGGADHERARERTAGESRWATSRHAHLAVAMAGRAAVVDAQRAR